MKTVMDFTVSLVLLVLLLPLMLLIALLIRMKLGSPVLFKQVRPGLHGKPFVLYKFRTMADWHDTNGHLLPDADRLSPFGEILRKYSLDELPQLINVLKGDLSLVGPRPLLMEYLTLYTDEQSKRHRVKPGITGWAQVNGRNAIMWEHKFVLDVWYVEHQTVLLDLKIIWLTVLKLFTGDGISAANHITMPKFTGSHDSTE